MRRSVAGIAWQGGRLLLARRKPGGVNSRLWEFPGGKVDTGESPAESLAREFLEELGVAITVGELLATGSFRHRNIEFRLEAYRITLASTDFQLYEHEEVGWFTPEEAAALPLVPSDRDILPELRRTPS
ncbi:MAG: NUDIX domain-containing protein [Spirochaetes bacterium]|nr:NUDIX domain-containing protein [Spirochaetota bacterium]